MKKFLIALAFVFPLSASAQERTVYTPPTPVCTAEISYIIRDSSGSVMDSTVFNRNWPIDCITSTLLKYKFISDAYTSGRREFTELTGVAVE